MSSIVNKISPASFGQRFLASLIDSVLITVISIVMAFTITFSGILDLNNTWISNLYSLGINVLFFIVILYFWRKKEGTPGKMLLGLKVVDKETKGKMTLKQMVIRQLMYIPSTLVFFLGFFWMLWDEDSQCWHDKVSNTVVIETT